MRFCALEEAYQNMSNQEIANINNVYAQLNKKPETTCNSPIDGSLQEIRPTVPVPPQLKFNPEARVTVCEDVLTHYYNCGNCKEFILNHSQMYSNNNALLIILGLILLWLVFSR